MPKSRILYHSLSKHADFDSSDLEILRESLINNASQGITGFLVRSDTEFYQALHGDTEALVNLLGRLNADERHSELEILLFEDTAAQSPFENWAMSYDQFGLSSLGISSNQPGTRTPISKEDSERIWAYIASVASEDAAFGSAFPYARLPGETDLAYAKGLHLA